MNRVVLDPTADAVLKYINNILMEEELEEDQTCILQDSALQDAEKPFLEIIAERCYPSKESPNLNLENQISPTSNYDCNGFMTAHNFAEPGLIRYLNSNESSCLTPASFNHTFPLSLSSNSSSPTSPPATISRAADRLLRFSVNTDLRLNNWQVKGRKRRTWELNRHQNEVILDFASGRVTPAVAAAEERKRDQSDQKNYTFDNASIYFSRAHGSACFNSDEACQNYRVGRILHQTVQSQGSARGKFRRKNQVNSEELVDVRTLLMQCAEAVAGNDHRAATEILMQIRQHSTQTGDGSQRLAFFFANALEARIAGTGFEAYTSLKSKRVPSANILKACRLHISACPFMNMSYFYSNQIIMELAEKADRLHIIYFGVLYGFPWISLIQNLSKRSGKPPFLRITAIELPQPAFYPAVSLEETGQSLATYCQRFNIPFEYNWISNNWESIRLEDLKIDANEVIAVNSLYRFRHLLDETVVFDSQRDAVLNLIKTINPDVFIHGIVNGAYNSPFFISRFKEAIFYYSAMFDVFEANSGRGDTERMILEQEVYGKEILNVVASEGSERVERPETYKQWQVRNLRAGLKQVPLKEEAMNEVREQVKMCYHKDFLVDQDGHWMLQGWKGRILFALSCWKSLPS